MTRKDNSIGFAAVEETYSDRTRKVLLVEDNLTVQMIHKVMLIELGCSVDVVSTGEDALLLIENDYDLIMLDIELPGINGIAVAKRFREHEKHADTRMIAVTTNTNKAVAQDCLSAGIIQVLMKPVDWAGLKKLLNGELEKQL